MPGLRAGCYKARKVARPTPILINKTCSSRKPLRQASSRLPWSWSVGAHPKIRRSHQRFLLRRGGDALPPCISLPRSDSRPLPGLLSTILRLSGSRERCYEACIVLCSAPLACGRTGPCRRVARPPAQLARSVGGVARAQPNAGRRAQTYRRDGSKGDHGGPAAEFRFHFGQRRLQRFQLSTRRFPL